MNDRHRIGLTALLAIGIYASSLQYGFTAIDDGGQVLENPFVQSLDFESLKGMFTNATVGMYQPLTTLLFALINAVFDHDSATPFHLFSLLLHAMNAGLVCRSGSASTPARCGGVCSGLAVRSTPLGGGSRVLGFGHEYVAVYGSVFSLRYWHTTGFWPMASGANMARHWGSSFWGVWPKSKCCPSSG